MKKYLVSLSVFLAIGAIIIVTSVQTTDANQSGAPGYCSGSPYDGGTTNGTCDYPGCHSSHPLQGLMPGGIRTNVPGSGYVPGMTYTITCKGTRSGDSYFGFQFTTQNNTVTGAVVGTFANIKTSGYGGTQLTTASPSVWVTHINASTYNGGKDSCVWSFKWTAPKPGVGTVHCWVAFNCANTTGTSSGSYVYVDSLKIPQSTVGIDQLAVAEHAICIYPNPIKDQFNVNYTLDQTQQVSITLYSIDGKQISELLPQTEQTQGTHTQTMHLPNVTAGVYLIEINQGGQSIFKRVIVE